MPKNGTASFLDVGIGQMQKLLKVPEVAEQLNLSPKTIWMWIARKEIGVHRIGGSVRIAQSELDRILAEGEQPARRGGAW
jgi:excisionase family DNA binding protein